MGDGSVTKRDLIEEVAQRYPRFSRRDAEVMVNTVFDSMTEALARTENGLKSVDSAVLLSNSAPPGKAATREPARWSRLRQKKFLSLRSGRSYACALTASRLRQPNLGTETTPEADDAGG